MEKTFEQLEQEMRQTLKAMHDRVKFEWNEYGRGLIDGAYETGRFTGEWDHDETVLDDLSKTLRLEAATQMQRNGSTWSGGPASPNNVTEGVRHAEASEAFSGPMNWNLHKAYRALDFTANKKEG